MKATEQTLSKAQLRFFTGLPGFATDQELKFLGDSLQLFLAGLPEEERDFRRRTRSVHSAIGQSTEALKRLYEPNGRLELMGLPREIEAAASALVGRAMPLLEQLLPAVTGHSQWIYVEYSVGQYITPHIDGVVAEDSDSERQIAGINLWLNDDFEGGEFVVSTDASMTLIGPEWRSSPGVYGADSRTQWFNDLDLADWVIKPRRGTALVYGAQLVHSTRPVVRGTAKRLISFLTQNG
jgi:hypothetical protein